MQTSLIPFESSLHGAERRKLRNISKRDLQLAVKYGKKSIGYPSHFGETRWVFEFADIIYVTDSTCTKEITSYVKPIKLPVFPTSNEDLTKFRLHHEIARQNPAICTSHTVLVIDQSASMKTCDVENFKTRSDSVYGHVALEYITNQLEKGASYTDVVSIIEMRDTADIILNRAPMSKVLYNTIVKLKKQATPSSHGNYLPSIRAVKKLVEADSENNQCAVVVLFLSDGSPSDTSTTRFYGNLFQEQLDSSLIASLINSLTHLGTSLLQTKMRMTKLEPEEAKIAQQVKWDYSNFDGETSEFYDEGWRYFYEGTVLWEYIPNSNPEMFDWVPRERLNPNDVGFAKRERIFGQGAERIVYELREFGVLGKELGFIGERYVAKDNRFRNDKQSALTNMKFHTVFAKTQRLASEIAAKFNRAIANLSDNRVTIVFLECFCYVYEDVDGFLVERLIDKSKYRKWNDNRGTVNGLGNSFEQMSVKDGNFDQSEFLQAFSHWSYRDSCRKYLVCDLQGVFTDNETEKLFELTDPVIHHESVKGIRKRFGRTDHGKEGIKNFFKSHICGNTCQLLGNNNIL